MFDSLMSIVAPHSCSGCSIVGSLLCDYCKNDIISEPFSRCLVCLKPTSGSDMCERCKSQTHISDGWCVGAREGALKALLDLYKFDAAREGATTCAELLDSVLPLLARDTVIVPVPTAPGRIRVRGFDHTARIARALAKQRGLQTASPLRRLSGDVQHFKKRAERLKTAANSLEVNGTVPASVLLIDDIYTTGATIQACVDKLRSGGAQTIYVAIIARQTLDEPAHL